MTEAIDVVHDVTTEEPAPRQEPVPAVPEPPAVKTKSPGLRRYIEQLKRENKDLKARERENADELAYLRRELVLEQQRVPAAFRTLAHSRRLEPTREAVEDLIGTLRAEADSARRVLAEYDGAADGPDDLPEVDGYSPDEVKAAVAAAVTAALTERERGY